MRLLRGADELRPVFATAQRSAFHLETHDDYASESESESLAAFRADESTDPGGEWFSGWTNHVAATVARGVAVRRARIVTEPHTLYTRYLLALSRHNLAAGEEIRYLARQHADPFDSATEDFWLFDERAVAFSLFDGRGYWVGAALTDEPMIVAHAVAVRDRVWPAAIPFEEYANR
ncbi:hypothetical protein GV791_00800 [Nocardia cyriacigeorgica]|uniref:DUF6879 domain-containing protein n=1 Tax=Nocardia cyriacigeorgica TaxID=135487 RepID=A0A6P1CES8_9NOCA|nr:DUF6879 family protein [Nocardia cyriacigeorgica]MBF6284825.1 hypothetical protein [Nocardia cyriacigeorgica]NEW31100.1 hypothetical protein [Nocardia cyriacigeorgica]